MSKLSVIVPCFNEEAVFVESYRQTKAVLDTLSFDTAIIYINDGSTDRTHALLNEIALHDRCV